MALKKANGRACRNKGARAEAELVQILTEAGLPSVRVLGSGAYFGAKSDLKVGVKLVNGQMPDKDEAVPMLRAEVKNRATNPEWLHTQFKNEAFAFVGSSRLAPEFLFDYLNQDSISKCVFLRRNKIPTGALANKDYNNTHLVVIGLGDYMALLRELYELKNGEQK